MGFMALVRLWLLLVSVALAFPAEAKQPRSQSARHSFVRLIPCPATDWHKLPCQGYVIDHIVPLCAGGADNPSNMQWQTVGEAKVKDSEERKQCRRLRNKS